MATRDGADASARLVGHPAHGKSGGFGVDWAVDPKHYRRLFAILAALMIAFSVAPISNNIRQRKNKDYTLWYKTGVEVRQGVDIYPRTKGHLFPFMYPPAAAAMLGLLSYTGEHGFVVSLLTINSAAWISAIFLSVWLATGSSWKRNPFLYVLPSAAIIPLVHDTYLLGQPNLLLLALMLGVCACIRLGKQEGAGALVALAAGIKAFPILALGYFVYRRMWKAVAATIVSLALLLLVLPLAFRTPAQVGEDLVIWTKGMVLKYDEEGIAQRPERCYSFKNQSLVALANRLLRDIPADGEAKDGWKVSLASLPFATLNKVVVALSLGLCLAYVAAMPRASRRTPRSDAIEFAMLLLLILAFSPLSFNYFYVWLIYPMTLALTLVLETPEGSRARRLGYAWIATPLVLLALAIPFIREAQAYGNQLVAGLVLFFGLGWNLWTIGRPAGTSVGSHSGSSAARSTVSA